MHLEFSAIAPIAVTPQQFTFCHCHPVGVTPEMLPLLLPLCYCSCHDSQNMVSEGGRAATCQNWSAGTVCVCKKKGYLCNRGQGTNSLASPQEKGPRTHVIVSPWDSASSLYFSGWISDQRYWGLQGSGNIIAVKYRLNEITWRHSAVQKKKKSSNGLPFHLS